MLPADPSLPRPPRSIEDQLRAPPASRVVNTVASPPSPAPAPALLPAASSDGWPPFAVAALRALLSAVLVGGTTFLATYTRTSDAKTLAIATMTAVLGVLTARLGAEGVVDQARANRGGT